MHKVACTDTKRQKTPGTPRILVQDLLAGDCLEMIRSTPDVIEERVPGK